MIQTVDRVCLVVSVIICEAYAVLHVCLHILLYHPLYCCYLYFSFRTFFFWVEASPIRNYFSINKSENTYSKQQANTNCLQDILAYCTRQTALFLNRACTFFILVFVLTALVSLFQVVLMQKPTYFVIKVATRVIVFFSKTFSNGWIDLPVERVIF